MYLLPKIHKGLENVPGRPVIPNCGTPTEKALEFLHHHLQPIMESGVSYIKDKTISFSNLRILEKYQKMRFLLQMMLLGYTQASPMMKV